VEQWGRLAEIAEKAQEAGEDKELPETIDVGEEDEE
jgi:hypothetical protein